MFLPHEGLLSALWSTRTWTALQLAVCTVPYPGRWRRRKQSGEPRRKIKRRVPKHNGIYLGLAEHDSGMLWHQVYPKRLRRGSVLQVGRSVTSGILMQ